MTTAVWFIAIATLIRCGVDVFRLVWDAIHAKRDAIERAEENERRERDVQQAAEHNRKALNEIQRQNELNEEIRDGQEQLRQLLDSHRLFGNALIKRGCDKKIVEAVFTELCLAPDPEKLVQRLGVLKMADDDQAAE